MPILYTKHVSVKIDQMLDQSPSEGRKNEKLNVTQRLKCNNTTVQIKSSKALLKGITFIKLDDMSGTRSLT